MINQITITASLGLAVLSGYLYWEHGKVQEGYDACMVQVEERDRYTEQQSERLRAESAVEKEKIENAYTDAINVWAGYADGLRVKASRTAASRSAPRVPEASCPESDLRSSEETLSIKAVELIIEKICLPHMEIR